MLTHGPLHKSFRDKNWLCVFERPSRWLQTFNRPNRRQQRNKQNSASPIQPSDKSVSWGVVALDTENPPLSKMDASSSDNSESVMAMARAVVFTSTWPDKNEQKKNPSRVTAWSQMHGKVSLWPQGCIIHMYQHYNIKPLNCSFSLCSAGHEWDTTKGVNAWNDITISRDRMACNFSSTTVAQLECGSTWKSVQELATELGS